MDCTGHGVPGALLSMVASFSMNSVVAQADYKDPKELIIDFNDQFCTYFQHHENENKDLDHGLDIGMVILDREENTLRFNGTRQSLIYTNRNSIDNIRGDSAYIGNSSLTLGESTNLPVSSGGRYFLFSDGIVDQFGGPKNKKFLARRLRQLLFDTRNLDMKSQKDKVENEFDLWKGEEEQTDDILLIGFEIE
jgi:serine phosphatase RsbU (regulator of sigma subunit)